MIGSVEDDSDRQNGAQNLRVFMARLSERENEKVTREGENERGGLMMMKSTRR